MNKCPLYKPQHPHSHLLKECRMAFCPILGEPQRVRNGYPEETEGLAPLRSFVYMRYILALLSQRESLLQREILKYFPEAKMRCLDYVDVYVPRNMRDVFFNSKITPEEYVQLVDDRGLQEALKAMKAMEVLGVMAE